MKYRLKQTRKLEGLTCVEIEQALGLQRGDIASIEGHGDYIIINTPMTITAIQKTAFRNYINSRNQEAGVEDLD